MDKKQNKTLQKSITIREDQEEYIKDIHLNLSRFVQDKLDEHMGNNPNWNEDDKTTQS